MFVFVIWSPKSDFCQFIATKNVEQFSILFVVANEDNDEDKKDLFPDEMIRLDGVAAQPVARVRLDGEAERDGEILGPVPVVRHAKGQRARPAPQVAIDGVELVLQPSVNGVEIVRGAETPVVVHAQKHRAADEVVAVVHESGARIDMAEAPAPTLVWREGDLMVGQV